MDWGPIIDYARENVPFMLASTQAHNRLSAQRLIEALIIAGCSGAASFYATEQVIDAKFATLTDRVQRVEVRQDKIDDRQNHDAERLQDQINALPRDQRR